MARRRPDRVMFLRAKIDNGEAAAVHDRAPDVLTVDNIGRTRALTPEGYLLCEGVRIARTGVMMYLPPEVPEITPPPSGGMIAMERQPEVLFSDETLKSFQGKSVTNTHPDDLVDPTSWRVDTVGVVLNPRRGDDAESGYLLADLLITDADAIEAVMSGLREVSCGYDGEREEVSPGFGRFTRIIGNHVALVERGRCGPVCAIGDSKENTMKKRSVWDRLMTAFAAKDEAAFKEELEAAKEETAKDDEAASGGVHIHNYLSGEKPDDKKEGDDTPAGGEGDPMQKVLGMLDDIGNRLTALETAAAKNAADEAEKTEPEKTEAEKTDEEEERKEGAKDAAPLRDEFQDVVARAEILSPGIKLPSFDAKAKRKTMADAMCGLRVAALKQAFANEKRREFVTKVAGKKSINFDKLACDQATVIFLAASELARAANNARTENIDHASLPQGPMTAAKMQQIIIEHRKKR